MSSTTLATKGSSNPSKVFIFLVFALGLVSGLFLARGTVIGGAKIFVFYLVSLGLGVLTGIAEIFPRYRDDPWRAAFCRYGLLYLSLNGFVALIAWAVIWEVYRTQWGIQAVDGSIVTLTALKYSALSGLAAMALIRSKIFRIPLEDGREISVGPDHIIGTLLTSTDAYIDRHRAEIRTSLVTEKFSSLASTPLSHYAVTLIFGARQTMTEAQEKELGKRFATILSTDAPEREKSLRIGFLVVNHLGEDFVRNHVLPNSLTHPAQPAPTATPTARTKVPVKKANPN